MFVSQVTEKEIFKGVLTAKNQENNVLFFQREIIDIEAKFEEAKLNNKNLSLFKRFIDIDKNEIDQEVKSLVTELKNRKVPSVLASQNIFEFDVTLYTFNNLSQIHLMLNQHLRLTGPIRKALASKHMKNTYKILESYFTNESNT